MNRRNWGIIIAAVVIVLILAYALGWFGGAEPTVPATTTTPPATGTTQ